MTQYYNILIAEERTDKQGEVKTFWHRAGTMFPHEKGEGFNLVIPEGMSVSGRLVVMPRKDNDPADDTPPADEG